MVLKNHKVILIVVLACVFKQASILSAYDEAHQAKANVDSLYKILANKLSMLKMRFNQTEVKIAKTTYDLTILKKVKCLLEDITKHNSCQHEFLLLDYRHKQDIRIEAVSEIPKHFTVTLQVDHKELVDKKQAEKSGKDLRVFFVPSKRSLPIEIDRFVENAYTRSTTIRFRTQKPIPAGTTDSRSYALVFGGKYNGHLKKNPKEVYAYFEDFEGSNSLQGWNKVWGEWSVTNGKVFGKTGKSSLGSGEVGIYLDKGKGWKDVEVELDLMETGANDIYPGPFLRVSNPSLQHTTAWWFEYYTDHVAATMRPFKDNKDGSWKYKCNLPGKLVKNKWFHFKYRLQGNKIMQWANGKLIQDTTVGNEWMIDNGTIALGCHAIYSGSPTGCRSYYDNIKVQLLVPSSPKISLGTVCNIVSNLKNGPLGRKENPGNSCKQILEEAVARKSGTPLNGLYWIKTAANGMAKETFCDMKNGGWTLVGKISGQAGNIYNSWLVSNVNTDLLKSPKITQTNAKYGCIDARLLAVKHSTEVMFSSGDSSSGVGTKWIRWQLPNGREYSTWWNHAVGFSKVSVAPASTVTVRAWNGKTQLCYQNKYGIMPLQQHGGSYPCASFNKPGNTKTGDYCMAVGVLKGTADGWSQNSNGYDSPQSDSDWPNAKYNHLQPYLLVWLK